MNLSRIVREVEVILGDGMKGVNRKSAAWCGRDSHSHPTFSHQLPIMQSIFCPNSFRARQSRELLCCDIAHEGKYLFDHRLNYITIKFINYRISR